MPGLVKLQSEHKDDLVVIGIHSGKGTKEQIEKVVQAQHLPYPVLVGHLFDELKAWGSRTMPRMAVVDRHGWVRAVDLTPKEGEEKALELLAQPVRASE